MSGESNGRNLGGLTPPLPSVQSGGAEAPPSPHFFTPDTHLVCIHALSVILGPMLPLYRLVLQGGGLCSPQQLKADQLEACATAVVVTCKTLSPVWFVVSCSYIETDM